MSIGNFDLEEIRLMHFCLKKRIDKIKRKEQLATYLAKPYISQDAKDKAIARSQAMWRLEAKLRGLIIDAELEQKSA